MLVAQRCLEMQRAKIIFYQWRQRISTCMAEEAEKTKMEFWFIPNGAFGLFSRGLHLIFSNIPKYDRFDCTDTVWWEQNLSWLWAVQWHYYLLKSCFIAKPHFLHNWWILLHWLYYWIELHQHWTNLSWIMILLQSFFKAETEVSIDEIIITDEFCVNTVIFLFINVKQFETISIV